MNPFYTILNFHFKYLIFHTYKLVSLSWRISTSVQEVWLWLENEWNSLKMSYFQSLSVNIFKKQHFRHLTYELAVKNDVCLPETWKYNKISSLDWIKSFHQRLSVLSLWTLNGCSLSPDTGFNKFTVLAFFVKVEVVYSYNPIFSSRHRFNINESGSESAQKSH